MAGFSILSLADMIDVKGEDFCREVLSTFTSPHNKDVQRYITERSAIDFAKQRVCQTFLVFASYKGKPVLCGYFSIANKFIVVKTHRLSSALRRRLRKFATPAGPDEITITAPLIAQIGKNYTNEYNKLITGDELLHFAIGMIKDAQKVLGGKIVYLECEDRGALVNFYLNNGFVEFGEREMERDEKKDLYGTHLVQMLRYLD